MNFQCLINNKTKRFITQMTHTELKKSENVCIFSEFCNFNPDPEFGIETSEIGIKIEIPDFGLK